MCACTCASATDSSKSSSAISHLKRAKGKALFDRKVISICCIRSSHWSFSDCKKKKAKSKTKNKSLSGSANEEKSKQTYRQRHKRKKRKYLFDAFNYFNNYRLISPKFKFDGLWNIGRISHAFPHFTIESANVENVQWISLEWCCFAIWWYCDNSSWHLIHTFNQPFII